MENKQKVLLGIGAIVVIGIGAFMYVSRPLPPPTEPNMAMVDTGDNNTAPATGETVFKADSKSTATFEIDETLNGSPKHVVGSTSDVQGQVALNMTKPNESKIGVFKINARTLKTDSDRRDNTVGRMILKSADNANEFVIFEPSGVTGLPSTIKENEEFTFSIPGKLTVAGVTKDATFAGTGKVMGNELTAKATSTIKYQDFGMEIPKLPFLAWVDDKVVLTINFVGTK